jgi:hypothetical protein
MLVAFAYKKKKKMEQPHEKKNEQGHQKKK